MYYINMLMFTKQNRKISKTERAIKKSLLVLGYISLMVFAFGMIAIALIESFTI